MNAFYIITLVLIIFFIYKYNLNIESFNNKKTKFYDNLQKDLWIQQKQIIKKVDHDSNKTRKQINKQKKNVIMQQVGSTDYKNNHDIPETRKHPKLEFQGSFSRISSNDYPKYTTDFAGNSCINKNFNNRALPFYDIAELDNSYKFYSNIQNNIEFKIKNYEKWPILYPFNYWSAPSKVTSQKFLFTHHPLPDVQTNNKPKNKQQYPYNSSSVDVLLKNAIHKPFSLNMYQKQLDWNGQRSYTFTNSPYNLSKKFS